MSNYVNYQIALIPANASLIDKLNKLLVTGEESVTETSAKTETVKVDSKSTKPEVKPTPKAEETSGASITDLKNAAKEAKKNHGEEFTMQILTDAGVEVESTLGRSMGKVDADQYDDIIAAWSAGPQAQASSDEPEDDDDFGDDEDDGLGDEAPTAEAVSLALKAYAKSTGREEAKALMVKYGAAALSNIKDLSADKLTKLFAELV